jgi:serine/threonine protein kinase
MPLSPGTKVGDNYELVRQLDHGNMGELWIARQGALREVAIKFVLGARSELRPRFDAEIKAIARLSSNYIVRVFDWGVFEDAPYMIMELLSGNNLEALTRDGARMPPSLAVDYVVQAAAGLAQVHRLGIVHRDLKPANLFFDRGTGTIKVLDFGIAGAGSEIRESLTHDGAYMGTPNYSAPEQFDDTKSVTAAADIWALGAILYELLSGKLAFPGVFPAVLVSVREREPEPLAKELGLAAELVAIVERCLQKRPEARFATAEELIGALTPFGSVTAQAVALGLGRAYDPKFVGAATEFEAAAVPASGSPPVPSTFESMNQSIPPSSRPTFHSSNELVSALLEPKMKGKAQRSVVFMLGAGFSRPTEKGRGVADTRGIVARIREQLSEVDRSKLQVRLENSDNEYQAAFEFLAARTTRDEANSVIRKAVLEAYSKSAAFSAESSEEDQCAAFEEDREHWRMPPGVRFLGQIIAAGLKEPKLRRFARVQLTTNFDPLLTVSIKKAGGLAVPYPIDGDTRIPGAALDHCKIVHLHGFWREGDTLHLDLDKQRDQLESSLRDLLANSTLVVLGYGGWTDVFMQALDSAARAHKDSHILWGFYLDGDRVMAERGPFVQKLRAYPRIEFYEQINTNTLFEQLAEELGVLVGPTPQVQPQAPSPVVVSGSSAPAPPMRPIARQLAVLAAIVVALALLTTLFVVRARREEARREEARREEARREEARRAALAKQAAELAAVTPRDQTHPSGSKTRDAGAEPPPTDLTEWPLVLTGNCARVTHVRVKLASSAEVTIPIERCKGVIPRSLTHESVVVTFEPDKRRGSFVIQPRASKSEPTTVWLEVPSMAARVTVKEKPDAGAPKPAIDCPKCKADCARALGSAKDSCECAGCP